MNFITLILITLVFNLGLIMTVHATETSNSVSLENGLATEYNIKRETLNSLDVASRSIMATIYDINVNMKNVSRKRDQLNNSMIYAQSRVKNLAKQIVDLENRIARQKNDLSRRMRAIYKLDEESAARVLFSSASAVELDQSLKYLKLISENDFRMIRSFEADKKLLVSKSLQMKSEVARLLRYKQRIHKQENILVKNQTSKMRLLKELEGDRSKIVSNIRGIKDKLNSHSLQSLLDLSFFDKKGQLKSPISGSLVQEFGLIENPEFQYKLSHKGFQYKVSSLTSVKSIYSGRVSFVGPVLGYGQTVIIDHGDHYYSVYSRADDILVSEGHQVDVAQKIATTKNELYFEIRHFSDAIDPKPWLAN